MSGEANGGEEAQIKARLEMHDGLAGKGGKGGSETKTKTRREWTGFDRRDKGRSRWSGVCKVRESEKKRGWKSR